MPIGKIEHEYQGTPDARRRPIAGIYRCNETKLEVTKRTCALPQRSSRTSVSIAGECPTHDLTSSLSPSRVMENMMQINGEDVSRNDGQDRNGRLLIVASDPHVRDACAALADEFGYDLYSTLYIDNIVRIVKKFRPRGVVIDLGLFEKNGVELHWLLLSAERPLNVLFLEGNDAELTNASQTLAEQIGLNVKGKLQMPISMNRLEHVLQDFV